MPLPREPAPRRGLWPWPAVALAHLALTANVLAAVIMVGGPLRLSFGPIALRSDDAVRPLVLGAAAAVLLLSIGWRSPWSRRFGVAALASAAVLGVLAQHGPATWPVGDGALIELSVLHATRGHQLLGAYSQYGWDHPGPLPFYVTAPFYWLAGRTTHGLNVGVLFTNVASLGIAAWIVARRRETRATLAGVLFILLAIYVTRVPAMLTSAWNPHTPIAPLIALIFTSAAIASGECALLPLALFLASFAVQAHVGVAVAVGVLVLMATTAVGMVAWSSLADRQSTARIAVVALLLLEALWFLPLAEQAFHTPGNMTLIVRFFFSGAPGQPLDLAWRAWGAMLVSMFTPGFALATGGPLADPSTLWPSIAGTIAVVALVPAAAYAWRSGRRFTGWLAVACLMVSAAGLYSILRVRGPLGDYHIFWLSLVGVVNISIVIGESAAGACRWLSAQANRRIVQASACLVILYIAATGTVPLMRTVADVDEASERADVRRLFSEMEETLPASGVRHPVVRVGHGLWGVGAGVILQMERRDIPVSVAPEMVWLFGDAMAADGGEDGLLTIAETEEHQRLAERPFNRTLARSRSLYVDVVSLVDAPQYRP